MRPIRAALAALAVAAIVLTGCKAAERNAPAQPAGARTPTSSSTGSSAGSQDTSTDTQTQTGGTKQVAAHRPSAAQGVSTAIAYMQREVGMTAPVAGKLRWTGGDSAEVDVHPGFAEGHQPWRNGPVTVVKLQRLSKVWYVLGARTRNIEVDEPDPLQRLTSPVRVTGAALAFEGTVQVRVTQDRYGKDLLLGKGIVTGGGDELSDFDSYVAFRRPTGTTGSVIFSEQSMLEGQGAIAATVVRVRFAQPPAASCSPAAILPLLKRKFDNPSGGLVIVRADVKRCRNGYLHVYARPSNPLQFESEQLFMRDVNGSWVSVAEGTGIACSDTDVRPAMLSACRALGYRR